MTWWRVSMPPSSSISWRDSSETGRAAARRPRYGQGQAMRIAVLSIGDELMYGEILDSNFAHIAARLYAEGLPVVRHLSVGDDEEAIVAALRLLAADADAVIVTGGLGPTSDDRTAAAAAAAAGIPLRLDAEALAHIRHVAGRLGGDIPPAN